MVWKAPFAKDASQGVGAESLQEAIQSALSILDQIEYTTALPVLVPNTERFVLQKRTDCGDIDFCRTAQMDTPTRSEWENLVSKTTENLIPIEYVGDLSGRLPHDAAMNEYLESGQKAFQCTIKRENDYF